MSAHVVKAARSIQEGNMLTPSLVPAHGLLKVVQTN